MLGSRALAPGAPLCRAAWLVVAAVLRSAAQVPEPEPAGPTFHDITFVSGSPLGAQRLAITGSGFTTNIHDGHNSIEIGSDTKGWASCAVVEGACTVDCGSANRIVCDTDQVPEGWLTAADGSDIDLADLDTGDLEVKVTVCRSLCDSATPELATVIATKPFAFKPARDSHINPTLLGVSPQQIPADSTLSLTGSRFGNSIKDYRVVYVGAGRPPIGGNIDTGTTTIHAVCRPQALNRAANPDLPPEERRQPVMAEDFEPLPITPDFFRCQLGDFEAGSYNVSVQLPMGMAWANPVDTGLFSTDASGVKYEVQYYPTITEVFPHRGSVAGGTEVLVRGHGFSMDEADIAIELQGSKCAVVSSTLEEIVCVTEPLEEPVDFTCATGAASTDCATCAETPAMEGECTSCNAGAELSGGACYVTPTATITIEDGTAGVQAQGMISTPHGDSGATFLSDEGEGKGERWIVFSAALDVSGTYEVRLLVPPAEYCTPRASSVTVVIYHSGTDRRTVIDGADLSPPGPVNLGSFYFDSSANYSARVIVDNKGTTGCVGVDSLQLVPSSAQRPSTGCTDSAALNFEAAASSDDGSCIYVGGRGLIRQQWALMGAEVEEKLATASPASILQESVVVDRACPAPGENMSGWDMLTGDTGACSSIGSSGASPGDDCNADSRCTYNDSDDACEPSYSDCVNGRCPSHDACPEGAFCCLDGSHTR